ncbi:MAG: hypothetical protein IJ146_00460, partial [Kiritimatiellae bacterium]|nr:hypothetical protein [Kiritimatiellia bacterium]
RIYRGSGKIVIDSVLRTRTTSPSVPGCDVLVNGLYQMEQGQRFSPVRSLVFSATGRYNATENAPNTTVVHEKYAPNLPANAESGTRAVHPPVQLGDDSHLDTEINVSLFETLFDATSVTFHPGTTVTVRIPSGLDLHALVHSENPHVMTWSAPPEGVKFVMPEELAKRGFRLVPEAEGLRIIYLSGTTIYVR